jgi:hypothetical protein
VRQNWYRDVWLLLITASVLLLTVKTYDLIHDVRDGRRTSVGISCAATSAVIDAGRAVITGRAGGGNAMSKQFVQNLERLGYPPKKQREEAAAKAADFYLRSIVEGIAKQVGAHKAGQVVTPKGSLDCDAVRRLTHTG